MGLETDTTFNVLYPVALSYLYSIWHTLISNITCVCLCNRWKVRIPYAIVSLPSCHLPRKTCGLNVYCHISQHECNGLQREIAVRHNCFNTQILMKYEPKKEIWCCNILSISQNSIANNICRPIRDYSHIFSLIIGQDYLAVYLHRLRQCPT